jgi:hypothetical protein
VTTGHAKEVHSFSRSGFDLFILLMWSVLAPAAFTSRRIGRSPQRPWMMAMPVTTPRADTVLPYSNVQRAEAR